MNSIPIKRAMFVLLFCAAGATVSAQSDGRGHWSGSIETPGGPLGLEVDLDKTAAGWIGSASIPQQKATGIPLDAISCEGAKCSFQFKGGAGVPSFAGTLSADGKILDGMFSQGPNSLPLKLTRTGEAKVAVTPPSPPIAAEFLGSWEGAIQSPQGTLRVMLTLSNGKAGAEAQMVSVDQGNAQIPVSGVTQKGAKLTLDVKAVGGGYEGDINKEGTELNGTWTQRGNNIPLNLKKAPKP